MTSSQEDSPQPDYFSTKNNVLSVILQGYTSLPSLYHPDFVDPLKKIFSDDYQAIIESINQNKNSPDPDLRRHPDYPFRRWIDDIYQQGSN